MRSARKILIFYQYFATPKGSWGTRIYEFARLWVEKGYDVEVVTSVYSKSDICGKRLVSTVQTDGIKVTIVNVKIDNKHPKIRRLWSFLAYSTVACYFAAVRRPDFTIASSGPITVGLPGLISKYVSKSKLVFEIRDIWPQGAIELGIISNTALIKWTRAFERLMYRESELVVGLSPGMRDYVKQGFNHKNVISVTNSANLELFSSVPNSQEKARIAPTYAIYTGNIGEVNNSMWLLEACRELKKLKREDIKIVLIGDGQQREEICSIAKSENLSSFVHVPLIPKQELVRHIQGALVSLVPLKGTPVLNTSSPNKLFESLAAGVPVIQNTTGWISDYVTKHQIGFTLDSDDAPALAQLLIRIVDGQIDIQPMMERAKRRAQVDFAQDLLADKYLNAIAKLAK